MPMTSQSFAAGQTLVHPVYFDGCFGWLHRPTASDASDVAVVLCTGLRRDGSDAYRPLRILADELAGAGYPTLRFDYAGTGDSGDVEGGEYWSIWQRNVVAAIDTVRSATGAERVVLLGLRIGATLAVLAAEHRDVDGLLLVDPVVRGKSYMIQFAVEARQRQQGAPPGTDGLLLDELCLSAETVRRIEAVDLRACRISLRASVAIFSRDQPTSLLNCVKNWTDQGVAVTSNGFEGLESLSRPAHLADEPVPPFLPVLSWLQAKLPVRAADACQVIPYPVEMRLGEAVETPIRFGPEGQLFGMLCRPVGNAVSDVAVVIGNTGGDSHHGYARFSVEFARRLAARGIASFRMDFAGLGDSMWAGESNTHVFDVDRVADFSASFDKLAAFGYRRFAVHGVCSGAYHAFQAGLADSRVAALLLINLPWFTLRHEKAGPDSFARRSMAALSRRGVARFLLFALGDSGIRPLEQHFGPNGIDLCGSGDVEVSITPDLDHDLTGAAMRRDAADRMIIFLLETRSLRGQSAAAKR